MKRLFRLAYLTSFLTITSCGGSSGNAVQQIQVPTKGQPSIHDIQGQNAESPLKGQSVTFNAIVTGDFQDNDTDISNNLGGFYVQQLEQDNNPLTSEGIFVYEGSQSNIDVKVGDRITVSGTVQEFFGETQIASPTITLLGSGTSGQSLIKPVDISLPTSSIKTTSQNNLIANLEAYEGMLVRIPQKMMVTDLYQLDRYGEVLITEGSVPQTFTNQNKPDTNEYQTYLENLASRTIILDDGQQASNPSPIKYLKAGSSSDYSIRVGDSLTNLTGILRYSKSSGSSGVEGWRIEPVDDVLFSSDNPRPLKPNVDGNLVVASFNVLNFFSQIDQGQSICGPTASQSCRGADSSEELSRQLQKVITAISMMDADIVGLIELENNAQESISTLVNALNSAQQVRTYDFIDTGVIHTDAIKTGFIYDQKTVTPTGAYTLLTSKVDARFNENKNRPTLIQDFKLKENNALISIALNHLKSKGSSCSDIDDPDLNDGQGNCNITRTQAVSAIVDWFNSDPDTTDTKNVLIIGDFNAYLYEDSLDIIAKAGYSNLVNSNMRPYSYLFKGQAGALDHAFASNKLKANIAEVFEWHINADEPKVLDYNLDFGRNANLFDGNIPFRSSDHDPVIIGINLID